MYTLGSLKVTKDCVNSNYCESKTENFGGGTVIKTHCCMDDFCNFSTSLKFNSNNISLSKDIVGRPRCYEMPRAQALLFYDIVALQMCREWPSDSGAKQAHVASKRSVGAVVC